ncbi:hemicentin-2-like isoform X1 [Syngnathus typhle]|uniref:hemicentin-2-like isoform X1 n=2 Tax=Syngnathus typhle TaxID=161592 RepID=UPI002A6A4F38|nr:hemicentin-2-like isoform X1 [Syngnathus typhle]
MVLRSCYRRRGLRELLIMRLRPALVSFILLLLLGKSDEAGDCEGVRGHVKLCPASVTLKLDSTAAEDVTWTFEGKTNSVPGGATFGPLSEKKKILTLPNLSAADSGMYTATFGPSGTLTVHKFTILVGAVPCTAATPCNVTGSSITMDSGGSGAVVWVHTPPSGTDTPITEGIKFSDNNLKAMGLFNVQAQNAGTYKATDSVPTSKDFPVVVKARVTAATIQGKAAVCPGGTVSLECKVTGDAKAVTWKKNDVPTTANVDGKDLTISAAKLEDAAKYTCRAKSYPGGQPVDSSDFVLTVSAAVDCEKQQKGTNSSTSIINSDEKKPTFDAARAASCSVALLLMTSLLQLCWML